MNVTLKQFQLFEAVIRLGNITRAAEEAHLSQPAVSIQIKRFEEAIGHALIENTGRPVRPTEAGRIVLSRGRAILREMASLEADLDSMKGLKTGQLRISAVTTVNYFVPPLLRSFCDRFPGIKVVLDVANRKEMLRQLTENEVDLGIMGQPPEDLALDATPFLDNPLIIVAPGNHPLARRRTPIPLSRLAEEPFLMREPGSGTRHVMERVFDERGIKVKTSVEVSGAAALNQSVQAGLGLALMSRDAVEMPLQLGRLVELNVEDFPIVRQWYLVHRVGKKLSTPAEAFKAFILENAAEILHRERALAKAAVLAAS